MTNERTPPPKDERTSRTGRRSTWLLPLALIAAGGLSFGGVTLFMHRQHSDPAHASISSISTVTAPSTTQGSAPQGASNQPSTTPRSSLPGSGSLSSQATFTGVAAFPSDSVASCGGGAAYPDETVEPLSDIKVYSDPNEAPGCSFVHAVARNVSSKVSSDPAATSFTVTQHSSRGGQNHDYTVDCTREKQLSTCAVVGSIKHTIIYVRDGAQ